MNLRKLTLTSVLIASTLAIQLLPRPPNVEFTSLMTFVTGLTFGSITGALFGSLIMLVNGFLSPWGIAGLILPFQMIGMAIIGIIGGLYGKIVGTKVVDLCLETALLGALLTFVYDLITNVGFTLAFVKLEAIVAVFIAGIPFTIVHVGSNLLIFGLAVAPISLSLNKLARGWS